MIDPRIWWEARLLPFRLRGRDLAWIIRHVDDVAVTRPPPQRDVYADVARIRCDVQKATSEPWLMRDRRCLRQGILAYRGLKRIGLGPRLCFSVDAASVGKERLAAHCWVELDGESVCNADIDGHVPVLAHPS